MITLKNFGRLGSKPDPKVHGGYGAYAYKKRGEYGRDERKACKWWCEAMDIIEPELRAKGIVQ